MIFVELNELYHLELIFPNNYLIMSRRYLIVMWQLLVYLAMLLHCGVFRICYNQYFVL